MNLTKKEKVVYAAFKGAMYLLIGYAACRLVKGVKMMTELPNVF